MTENQTETDNLVIRDCQITEVNVYEGTNDALLEEIMERVAELEYRLQAIEEKLDAGKESDAEG